MLIFISLKKCGKSEIIVLKKMWKICTENVNKKW